MITLLGGGIGASRFSKALAEVVPEEQLTCVVNTADDLWLYGLRICPDIDTTLYAHAGLKDDERGWGLKGDSFRAMEQMGKLGERPWFNLGDLDLATHLLRTDLLRQGETLTHITRRFAETMGVRLHVLPMTEQEVETYVLTPKGWLHYQQFLVRYDAQDSVTQICYRGSETAQPGPGVITAIQQSEQVIIAPSNPFASVVPMLSLPGVRQALAETTAMVLAITPIVSGIPIEDLSEAKRARSRAALMMSHGLPHKASAVVSLYRDIVDVFVLDEADQQEATYIESLGMTVVLAPTLFHKTTSCAMTIKRLLQHYPRLRKGAFSSCSATNPKEEKCRS